MNYPLYNNNNNYYIIIQQGCSYSYVINFHNFSTRLISNEDINGYEELDFNLDNLKRVLTNFDKLSNINIDDFDKSLYSKMIYVNGNICYVNSWRDILNIIQGV